MPIASHLIPTSDTHATLSTLSLVGVRSGTWRFRAHAVSSAPLDKRVLIRRCSSTARRSSKRRSSRSWPCLTVGFAASTRVVVGLYRFRDCSLTKESFRAVPSNQLTQALPTSVISDHRLSTIMPLQRSSARAPTDSRPSTTDRGEAAHVGRLRSSTGLCSAPTPDLFIGLR